MDHGLKAIKFYVQKHITPCTVVTTSLLARDKPPGAPVSVKRVYRKTPSYQYRNSHYKDKTVSRQSYCSDSLEPESLYHDRDWIIEQPWRLTFWHSQEFWHQRLLGAASCCPAKQCYGRQRNQPSAALAFLDWFRGLTSLETGTRLCMRSSGGRNPVYSFPTIPKTRHRIGLWVTWQMVYCQCVVTTTCGG